MFVSCKKGASPPKCIHLLKVNYYTNHILIVGLFLKVSRYFHFMLLNEHLHYKAFLECAVCAKQDRHFIRGQ